MFLYGSKHLNIDIDSYIDMQPYLALTLLLNSRLKYHASYFYTGVQVVRKHNIQTKQLLSPQVSPLPVFPISVF